jgi:hypothetical protein
MKFKYAFIALCVTLSCSIFEADEPLKYLEAKEKWEASGLNSYSYVLNVSCFCANLWPAELVVENGSIVAIYEPNTSERKMVDGPEGEPVYALDLEYYSYPTIDSLFKEIELALKRKNDVRAEFNPSTGMPIEIAIDEDKLAMDAGVIIRVSNFVEIN